MLSPDGVCFSAGSRRPSCTRAQALGNGLRLPDCIAHHENTHLLLGEEPGKQLREGQPHPGGLVFKRSTYPPGPCTYPKDLSGAELRTYDCPPCLLKPAGSMSGKPFVKLTASTPSRLKLRAAALRDHAAPFHLPSCPGLPIVQALALEDCKGARGGSSPSDPWQSKGTAHSWLMLTVGTLS